MKTKMLLLCAMLTIASLPSFTQIDTFDLSKYKVADYKRHSLEFALNSNTNTYVSNIKYKDSKEHDRDDWFESQIRVDYYYRFNTRKKQEYLSLNTLLTPYNMDKQKNGSPSYFYSIEKQTNSNLSFSYDYSNSFYSANEFFFKIGASGNNSGYLNKYNHESNYNDNYVEENTEQSNVYLRNSIVLGIGKGRIENVEDARMAVYILDDLIKNKSLSREPSEEEILELASIITQLKNKRFFDYRIRKIHEIQALDTFLNKTGLVTKTDAVYFTTLNDNWTYSNNPIRTAGDRLSLNLMPNFRFEEYRYSTNNPELSEMKKLGFIITGEYLYTKPINLQWQFEYNFAVGFNKEKYWSNRYYNNFSNDILFASATLTTGFYPNSRSYISFSIVNMLSKTWTDSEYLMIEDIGYNLNLAINAYYYFSERLSANLNSYLSLNYDNYPKKFYMENRLGLSPHLQLSMNYALF